MAFNFYYSPKPKYRYFVNVDTWIDVATVFPEYISWAFTSSGGFDVSFLRILRVFKIIRILKFQKTLKKIRVNSNRQSIDDSSTPIENISRLKKQLMLLIVSLFATFFISAGIVLFVQELQEDAYNEVLKFDSSIYFVTITVSSMGYGDILPITVLSRIVTMIILLCVFTIFGNQISKIVAIMKENDEYDVHYSLSDHAIVFWGDSIDLLSNFLMDYLEFNSTTKVLVIGEREMAKTIKPLLNLSYLEGKLDFLSLGKGFDKKTIKKSWMRKCKEVFFINDPHSLNWDENDKKALFLKTFLVNNGINVPFYLQLSLQNEIHIINLEKDINQNYMRMLEELKDKSSDSEDSFAFSTNLNSLTDPCSIDVISYRKFMFNLWAKNTFWEGFIPFISWFLTKNEISLENFSSVDLYDKLWENYWHSLNYYIATGLLPANFDGLSFQEAATRIGKLNNHYKLKNSNISIFLIGLLKIDGGKKSFLYSPMDKIINIYTMGIYFINNTKMSGWANDQNEINKLLREVEHPSLKGSFANSKHHVLNDMKRTGFKVDTEEYLMEEEKDGLGQANYYYKEKKDAIAQLSLQSASKLKNIRKVSPEISLGNLSLNISETSFTDVNEILEGLDILYKNKHFYKANLKTDVIDINQNLKDDLENHIIICGFKEGLEYYVESIRNTTNVPICVIASARYKAKINRLYKKFINVFYYQGDLTDVNCLQNANVSRCQHVLILTTVEGNSSNLDWDGIMIANFLQENYPHVKFWVEIAHQRSTQLISYSIFSGKQMSTEHYYSLSFMTGKIFDSTTLYKMGSLLRTNPVEIDFITNLMNENPNENRLVPLMVNDYLAEKTYSQIYYEFLNNSAIKMILFGVFSWHLGHEINSMIKKIFLSKEDKVNFDCTYKPDSEEKEEESTNFLNESIVNNWLLPTIPVFKILNPESDYKLVKGDILYCYGKISDGVIAEYLWKKKHEEFETQSRDSGHLQENTQEEIEQHNNRVELLIKHLGQRLIRQNSMKISVEKSNPTSGH
jgi:hypothetical protein